MHENTSEKDVIDFAEARVRHQLMDKRLEVDVKRYQNYLDNTDLTKDERAEFIKTLWSVMVAFVDFGYGINPVQVGSGQVINIMAELKGGCGNSASRGVENASG